MSISDFIRSIAEDPGNRNRISNIHIREKKDPVYSEPEKPLPEIIRSLLKKQNISRLYTHQAESLDLIRNGKDIVVETSTASGKTLCYNLPVLESVLTDRYSRALYLFPTKALAYDQLKLLNSYTCMEPELKKHIIAGTYDGDTPVHKKKKIRDTSNIILSNPDMLHAGILSHHAKWAEFLINLKFVVIDEIHIYRGAFGSHIANLFRRFLRLCRNYRAEPQFICCSATIANPEKHAAGITSRKVQLVSNDGSPHGKKTFIFWNPPVIDPARMLRRSPAREANDILLQSLNKNYQTITFLRSRASAELLYRMISQNIRKNQAGLLKKIEPYRSGYLPEERRDIESRLKSRKLLAVLSTNALELGIDIGSLDICLIVGYPGSVSSFIQQAGRAGRKQNDSLVFFVAHNDPVDQYFISSSSQLISNKPEHAVIDPDNPFILAYHLSCAAFEYPLQEEDSMFFGGLTGDIINLLTETGYLKEIKNRWYWKKTEYPHSKSSLRNVSDDTFKILETGENKQVIGNMDSASVPLYLHPGAVYLHLDQTYKVQKLDFGEKTATVIKTGPDYYTMPVSVSSILQLSESCSRKDDMTGLNFGNLEVRTQVTACSRIKFHSNENLGMDKLDLPPDILQTDGTCIYFIQEKFNDIISPAGKLVEGIIGIKNLFITALTFLAMCDKNDIGGTFQFTQEGNPAVYLFDRYQGGLGYSEQAFQQFYGLLKISYDIVNKCICETGCPSCSGAPDLTMAQIRDPDDKGGWYSPDKNSAKKILHEIDKFCNFTNVTYS